MYHGMLLVTKMALHAMMLDTLDLMGYHIQHDPACPFPRARVIIVDAVHQDDLNSYMAQGSNLHYEVQLAYQHILHYPWPVHKWQAADKEGKLFLDIVSTKNPLYFVVHNEITHGPFRTVEAAQIGLSTIIHWMIE